MLSQLSRATLVGLGLIPFSIFADKDENSFSVFNELRGSTEISYIDKGRVGGNAEALIPIFGNADQFIFVSPQVSLYDALYHTTGIGIGHRQVVGENVYGLYAFYDNQRSPNKKQYDRINVGAQMLAEYWSLGTNIYWYMGPQKQTLQDLGTTASIDANNILYSNLLKREQVFNGADIEVGVNIGNTGLKAYAAYFNFDNVIYGGRYSLEYQLTNDVALKYSYQHDKVRSSLSMLSLSYRFGKGLSKQNTVLERLRAPIRRDMTVPVQEYQTTNTTVDARKVYFVDGNAEGDNLGSSDDPMTLAEAIAASNANDFIFLNGNNGDIDIGGDVTLKSGQSLYSNLTGLSVNGHSLITADSGTTPTLTGGSIRITSSATLSGLNFDGNNAHANGIIIDNAGTVNLENINVTQFTENGIYIMDNGTNTVNVTNVTATQNGTNGLAVVKGGNTSNLALNISNSDFSNNTLNGMSLNGYNVTAVVQNSTFTQNQKDGIHVIDHGIKDVTLTNVNANNNGEDGLTVTPDSVAPGQVDIRINSSEFNNNTRNGTNFEGHNVTAVINASQFDNNTNNGLFVRDNAKVTAYNTSFNTNANHGIYAEEDADLILNTTNINQNQYTGLQLQDDATATIIDSNLLGNQYGIFTTDNSRATIENSVIAGTNSSDRQEFGIYTHNNSRVTLTDTSVSQYNTGNFSLAMVAAANSQITANISSGNNSTDIQGYIYSVAATSNITINNAGTTAADLDGPAMQTCSITDSVGSCS